MNNQDFETKVIAKLHAEGLSLSSPWEVIKQCLSNTVSPTRCIEVARRLMGDHNEQS